MVDRKLTKDPLGPVNVRIYHDLSRSAMKPPDVIDIGDSLVDDLRR
jgi:hypothetical protein